MSVVDRVGCVNDTIKVAAGHYVDLMNPDPATIDIESIAAALSKICRFGGHTPSFYSVAEHSVMATVLAANEGYVGEALKAVLLHDATEAFLGDMVKPLKVHMSAYQSVEKRMEQAIADRFGVDFAMFRDVIHRYDMQMLKLEKNRFWPRDKTVWAGFDEIREVNLPIHFLPPTKAQFVFLEAATAIGLHPLDSTTYFNDLAEKMDWVED